MINDFSSKFDLELTRWRSRTPHLDQWRDYSERYLNDPVDDATDIQQESAEVYSYSDAEPF